MIFSLMVNMVNAHKQFSFRIFKLNIMIVHTWNMCTSYFCTSIKYYFWGLFNQRHFPSEMLRGVWIVKSVNQEFNIPLYSFFVVLLLNFCWLLLPLWDSVVVLCLLCVTLSHSSFAIILMGKRELVCLLCLSSWCFVIVVWLFLAMPRDCL